MKTSITYASLIVPVLGVLGYLWLHNMEHSHELHSHTHVNEVHDEPWVAPGPYPDRIALTWSDDPATSLSVTWRTDTTISKAVAQLAIATPAPRFDRAATSETAQTERLDARSIEMEDVVANYHSVTFTDLLPDTLYAYRVGNGELWSEWFQTRTASAEPAPFSFIYFGDAQNEIQSHWSRNIRAAYSKAPDVRFILHAGDLVNRAHRNFEWGEWFHAGSFIHSMLPSIVIPGNHEYRRIGEEGERELSIHWRPQFTLPTNGPEGLKETVYYLDIQGVRIIGLNSNTSPEIQSEWLEEVLSNNPNEWTIVTHHHPIFSSSKNRDNPELRTLWKPIYDEYHVDLVLQGHDHSYARGRDINVTEGASARDLSSGTVYVNSVSGAKMYEIKDDRWDQYDVVMERGAENTQLFQVISVASDRLQFRAYTTNGSLYDAFDLVKQDEGPNRFFSHSAINTIPERTHENTIPYRTENQ